MPKTNEATKERVASKISKKKVIYPTQEVLPETIPVFVDNDFLKLPYGQLTQRAFILFSAILTNVKDKGTETIKISATELSRITGEKKKQVIHENLGHILQLFAGATFQYRTIRNGQKMRNIVTLFDTFTFNEQYSPNFELEVSVSKGFTRLFNELGKTGLKYFDYDVNVLKMLPSRTFDNLLYVLLCSKEIMGKGVVTIDREVLINQLGLSEVDIARSIAKRYIEPAIKKMEELKILKSGKTRITKLEPKKYKIEYEINKAEATLFDFMN